MKLLACVLALYILVIAFDRLRLVNWKTAKPLTVAALLAHVGVGLWALYDAFTNAAALAWWHWPLMTGVGVWLHLTRGEWREGVPLHVQTGDGELGPPELKP